MMEGPDRITAEPGKRGGQPCIRGLRITVSDVLGYLEAGMSEDELLAEFPALEPEDIEACLRYASRALREPGHAPEPVGVPGSSLLRFSGAFSEQAAAEIESAIVDGCERVGGPADLTSTGAVDSSPEVLGGTPVFSGTRVPVRSLIDRLSSGEPLGGFLEDFPSVSAEQARQVLGLIVESLIGSRAGPSRDPPPSRHDSRS